jgi:hypothetical protein
MADSLEQLESQRAKRERSGDETVEPLRPEGRRFLDYA